MRIGGDLLSVDDDAGVGRVEQVAGRPWSPRQPGCRVVGDRATHHPTHRHAARMVVLVVLVEEPVADAAGRQRETNPMKRCAVTGFTVELEGDQPDSWRAAAR